MANFFGNMDDNVLVGGPDDDVLWGGAGDDELSGGAGNDRLIGGPGGDALDGGPGMDVASYTRSSRGVRVDLATSFADGGDDAPTRGGDAEGDSLTGIESIWGSNFADLLIGSHAANYLFGNGGNDEITGGSGNDLLSGGMDDDRLGAFDEYEEAGNDVIYGGGGIDALYGGKGNDLLFGGMGDDMLDGGTENDVLEGGMGADSLMGGPGSKDIASYSMSEMAVTINLSNIGSATMKAAEGGDADGDTIMMDVEGVRGSMHDDMITGSSAAMNDPATDADESMMYPGHNTLYGNRGNDTLKGMGGNDTIHGGKGNDTIYGGDGDDKLMGEIGDDAIKGEDGDDTLVGGPGADKLFGGRFDPATKTPGEDNDMMGDTADYEESDAGVTIDLSKTSRSMPNPTGEGGHAEGDELVAIEHLKGSMYDDMLTGTDEDGNRLYGMDGDDMLSGKGGDDKLDGGKGMDTLNGGAGADTLMGGDGDDTFVYRMVNDATASDDDTNTGRVEGAPDAPTDGSLDQYQIDETRYRAIDLADDQADGDPMVSGGGGMDTIDASGATGAVNVDLNVMRLVAAPMAAVVADSTATPPVAAQDAQPLQEAPIYSSIEMVIGGEGNDTLKGNAAAPTTLYGGEGDDGLEGGSKNDMLDGGAGDDNLMGSAGDDTLEGGSGNDVLDGGSNADMLMGGSGNDSLTGGTGHDTLAGGLGNDTLIGGDGADTYIYTGGQDQITFQVSRAGGDQIDLSALELTESELEEILAGARDDGTHTYLNVVGDWDAATGTGGWDIRLTDYLEAGDGDLAMGDFIL